jgi:hypothetical protein
VKGALNTGTVVIAKTADTRNYMLYVLLVNLLRLENYLPLRKAGFGGATQVKDYLQ